MTPPSAIASRTKQANAGPLPLNAVHASKCFSSRKRCRPMGLKSCVRMLRSMVAFWEDGEGGVMMVIPSRICAAGETGDGKSA